MLTQFMSINIRFIVLLFLFSSTGCDVNEIADNQKAIDFMGCS